MKFFFTFLIGLFLIVSGSVNAQYINGCGYKIPPRSLLRSNFKSVYEAKSIVKNMLDSIEWKENFQLQEQNGINNAYATIIRNTRWIVYDNDFLENLDSYAATKWASISVMAHEMGHHYYNHVVSGQGSTVPTEIEADAFSGYVMYKIGATLEQSIAAMKSIASDQASSTHPAKKDRLAAIAKGWNQAKATAPKNNNGANNSTGGTGNGGGNNSGSNSPGPGNTNTNTNTDPANDPSWIGLNITSTKSETVYLSDDGKNYQAVVLKAGESFVFKFEIYNYGWLKLPYFNGYRTYKLLHGKDYTILWNRRNKNWTVVEVPE
ncbi:MAG: M48 family metalloprotease [Chitinophagaceae bacterium]